MKKTILKSVLALFILTSTVTSCVPPPGLDVTEFLYAENNASTMISVADPKAYSNSKKIIAKTAGTTIIEMELTSLAVGTYIISRSSNKFNYFKPSTTSTWIGLTGSVTITENTGTKLSGNFNISSGTGISSVNLVNGSFTSVSINP